MNQQTSRRGIALVVVLVFLVLLSVFVVGFFSNSQDELTAAQSFTGEISAHQLGESAVSVVMGQIREATTRVNGAWGSQPGMIRVYRSGNNASNQADAFFKLYSSDDMILSANEISQWDPTREVPEGARGWNNQPAAWTDLNEKVRVILNSDDPTQIAEGFRYPILDPSLENKVEGLEFIPTQNADQVSGAAKARMPVRWLYVLRDGTLTAPANVSANGLEVSWNNAQRAPTATNPIVGRIAFWTDDETSKVNVNTAGGYSLKEVTDGLRSADGRNYTEDNYAGSFWDAPRAFTKFDRGDVVPGTQAMAPNEGEMRYASLALSQPVRGEFQRYPGHPSTTSLGILFRDRRAGSGSSMQDAPYLLTSGQLALLSPRLQWSTNTSAKSERGSNYGVDRLIAAFDSPPGLRVKRLYASVDELFFSQPDQLGTGNTNRTVNDFALGIQGVTNDKDAVSRVLTPDLLDKMRFFLTAYSRAPEMNLWGRPRMTLWPVTEVGTQAQESDLWNASDRLLAFCSTIGPDSSRVAQSRVTRFMLQRGRNGWTSPTADAAIARNLTLYNYMRNLTNQPVPGFSGGSFRDKYASLGDKFDRDQILTEMFDYMRVVNLRDSTRDKTIVPNLVTTTNPTGVAPSPAQFQQIESYRYAPRGLVVPLQFTADGNTTRGFGRFPSISEAAIVLYHAGYRGPDNKRYFLKEEIKNAGGTLIPPTHNLVRAFLVLETFNPMQGFAPITTPSGNSIVANRRPIVIEIDGLDGFSLNGQSLGFQARASTGYIHSSNNFWHGRHTGGSEGIFHTLYRNLPSGWNNATGSLPIENTHPSANQPWLGNNFPEGGGFWYPFQSMANAPSMLGPDNDPDHPGIAIPVAQTTAQLSAAAVAIAMKMNGQFIRRLSLNFPAATVPVPEGGQTPLGTDDPLAIWQTIPNVQNVRGGFSRSPDPNAAVTKAGFVPLGPYRSHQAYVKSYAGRAAWVRNADSSDYYNLARTPDGINYEDRWRQILQPGDVIRSVCFSRGDLRSSCLQDQSLGASSIFEPHPDYLKPLINGQPRYRANSLRTGNGTLYFPADTFFGNITNLISGRSYFPSVAADLPMTSDSGRNFNSTVVKRNDGQPGDFDTGLGNLSDGPYCNKADEGNLVFRRQINDERGKFLYWGYYYPYFDWTFEETFDTFFTPNRQVPSAVLFGSLLAGKNANWQTLCFSPNPIGDNHPGRSGSFLKDYLWLDLFSMPVVEPYAISEPFSTAGKINMNYQIVPFSNIKRSSGLRAALQPVRVTAFPAIDGSLYDANRRLVLKVGINGGLIGQNRNAWNGYRYLVDRDETLKAFDFFFSQFTTDRNNGFFKSAAQICDFHLYPREGGRPVIRWSVSETEIKTWWRQQSITGDNVREKPYADLYPRLTTKSNTFCVHIRAQALRQSAPSNPQNAITHYRTWSEKRDRVIGEYRGSSIIERYIDPQDERFTTSSTERINVDTQSLDIAYRFRVLNTKRFDP